MFILRFVTLIFCTFCFYFQYANSMSYEDRGKEVVAKVEGLKTTWSAIISPRFVGQDEFVLKKFCGIKPDFKTKFTKGNNGTKPIGKQKGRGGKGKKHGNHTKSWEDKKRKGSEDKKGNNNNNNNWNNNNNNNNRNNNFNPHQRFTRDTLPTNYDWRDHTTCESFDQIRYQTCGDCWAVSSAAAMSDRFCLYTFRNKYFSAKQITSCVYSGGGCGGGYPQDAAKFYLNKGVATGNDPTVSEQPKGCITYPSSMDNSVRCPTACDDGRALDITKAGDWREFTSQNPQDIMQEIYVYGSVVAIFEVFQDFGYMGAGVYQHVWGGSQGWHAIRLIGWGVENGVPYWQAANQWGTDWGDEGFFKILRGSNHCGIEGWITGVYPIEAWSL